MTIGELIISTSRAYPNIKRWLDNMKKLKSWGQVNEVFHGFLAANRGKQFLCTRERVIACVSPN